MSLSGSEIGITLRPQTARSGFSSKSNLITHKELYSKEKEKILNRWFAEDEKDVDYSLVIQPKTKRPKDSQSISSIKRIKRKSNSINQNANQNDEAEEEEKYVKPSIKYPPNMSQQTRDLLNTDWVTRLTSSPVHQQQKEPKKRARSETAEQDFEQFILRQNESSRRRVPADPLCDIHDVTENVPRCYKSRLPDWHENEREEPKTVFKGDPHLMKTFDARTREIKQASIRQQMDDEQQQRYIDAVSVYSHKSFVSKSNTRNSSLMQDIKTFDQIVEDYKDSRKMRHYL